MNQKGFINILIFIIVIVAIAGVGGYIALNKQVPSPEPGDIEEIQALLNKEQWVLVIVMLKGNEFTTPEFQQDDSKKKAEVKKIQDAVLITLTEKDFQISHQYQYVTSFAGMVSKSGMEKLLKNPQVISISLNRLSAPN